MIHDHLAGFVARYTSNASTVIGGGPIGAYIAMIITYAMPKMSPQSHRSSRPASRSCDRHGSCLYTGPKHTTACLSQENAENDRDTHLVSRPWAVRPLTGKDTGSSAWLRRYACSAFSPV